MIHVIYHTSQYFLTCLNITTKVTINYFNGIPCLQPKPWVIAKFLQIMIKNNNKRIFVVTCHSLVDTTFITRVIINTGHENAHIYILLFQLYYVKCYIWRFVNKSVRSNSSLITNGHPLTPRASWHCLSRSLTDMLCPNRRFHSLIRPLASFSYPHLMTL